VVLEDEEAAAEEAEEEEVVTAAASFSAFRFPSSFSSDVNVDGDDAHSTEAVNAAQTEEVGTVGPDSCHSPRYPTHVQPWFLNVNQIL